MKFLSFIFVSLFLNLQFFFFLLVFTIFLQNIYTHKTHAFNTIQTEFETNRVFVNVSLYTILYETKDIHPIDMDVLLMPLLLSFWDWEQVKAENADLTWA